MLAEEYVARYRRGERPALAEYVKAYPELAGPIQELFPALLMMEQVKPAEGKLAANQPGGELREPTSPFPIGRLGDFRILRVLGRGGMGVVYEAIQESLGRHVALKVLPPHGQLDATQLGRFRREARAAAGLHHTNIVPVFAVGEQDGVPFYAMQFIRGQGIDTILDELRRLRHDGMATGADRPQGPNVVENLGPPDFNVDRDTETAAITQRLLSGRFVVAAGHEPDRQANGTTSMVDLTAPTETERSVAEEIAIEEAIAPLSLDSSGLISQPGATYFRTIARIGAQTADALAYAHAQGICHRDIKPSNLLLDACGIVWVADFGLAKAESGAGEGLTQTGDIVGTLRYMAPERFNGWADARSDVYALGVTLYEMLTLRPAFTEPDRLKLIDRISNAVVPKPRSIDPRIPSDLETIILKAMARDASERYISARALAEDLERFLADRTILARRSSVPERAWRWCRRNPAVAGLTGLAATLVVLVAIVSSVAALVSIRQLDRTTKAERKTRLALGNSLIAEGAALQHTGMIGQRFDSLDRLAQAAKVLGGDSEGSNRLPEIRNHAITALGLTDMRTLGQRDCGHIYSLSVDAALERYAVADRLGTVVVHRLDDHRELVRLPAPEQSGFWHAATMFSPDGELLVAYYAYIGSGGDRDLLRVWHLGRRELLGSLQHHGGGGFYGGVFSPDSRRFLFCPPDGGIDIWDRDERRVVRRLRLDIAPHFLALDPQGQRLAVNNAGTPARVVILKLESGRVLADWRSQVGNTSLAWSADGQLLAIGSHGQDPRVYVWNVRRGELASVLPGHTSYAINAQFAHTGFLLAIAAGSTRLWDAASGELLATAPESFLGFAPDDRRLAFWVGESVGVWKVASSDECRTLHPAMLGNRDERRDAVIVGSSAFSPDGRLLATGDQDGIRLWEADAGREAGHLKAGPCEDILFHPDGNSLISSGQRGLYRWPIGPDPDHGAQSIQIGPPELLRESGGAEWNRASWLPDHRTVALIDNSQARVLLVDSSHPHPAWSRATALDSGENRRMTSVAISPDGRWLAVGGWRQSGIRVWDLHLRRLEQILKPNEPGEFGSFLVEFSPDGRWLSSCTASDSRHQFEFWHTGTWVLERRIDKERHGGGWYPPVYTGDGRLMALGIAPDQVLLADVATGREFVRLPTLHPVNPTPLAFSPDGTKLVASTNRKTVLVWNLRQVRSQLAPRGLDWNAPPYSEAKASAANTVASLIQPPLPVRVVGEVLEPQARRKLERAEMDRRLNANPDDAEALIHRGWLSRTERRLAEAIADLEHLHRQQPNYPDVERLLGQTYQEMGNPAAALNFSSRVLERVPEDHDTRLQRGLSALALGFTPQAAADFGRVLAADPTRDPARYHRVRAKNRLGRHREALVDLDVLIGSNPKDFMLYELRATALEALGEHEPAQLEREKAHSLLPKLDPNALNNLAWVLVTGPLEERDPERAVLLSRVAVTRAPDQSVYLNTLGIVLYRAGRCAEAVDVMERSLAAGRGQYDAFDLYFLAMAHHDLGHPRQARACFDRAVQWWDGKKALSPQFTQELTTFRAEAEAVLASPGSELPADVFASP